VKNGRERTSSAVGEKGMKKRRKRKINCDYRKRGRMKDGGGAPRRVNQAEDLKKTHPSQAKQMAPLRQEVTGAKKRSPHWSGGADEPTCVLARNLNKGEASRQMSHHARLVPN